MKRFKVRYLKFQNFTSHLIRPYYAKILNIACPAMASCRFDKWLFQQSCLQKDLDVEAFPIGLEGKAHMFPAPSVSEIDLIEVMVSTQLKNITQNGILPQIGAKIKNYNKLINIWKPPPSNESISAYPNIPSSFISVPIFPLPIGSTGSQLPRLSWQFLMHPNHNTWANHQVKRSCFLLCKASAAAPLDSSWFREKVLNQGRRHAPTLLFGKCHGTKYPAESLDIMFYFGAFPPFIRWMSIFRCVFYL